MKKLCEHDKETRIKRIRIYSEVKRELQIDDAKDMLEWYLSNHDDINKEKVLKSVDYDDLVDEFESEWDVNISESEIWEIAITKYIYDNGLNL